MIPPRISPLAWLLGALSTAAWAHAETADLIVHNAKVWTVEDSRPVAQAVSIRAGRILRVGAKDEVLRDRGPATRLIDVEGALVLPGFIDAHTHFENAADWLFNLSLYGVTSQDELIERLREKTARIPKGVWITGGDLGAYATWDAQARGETPPAGMEPDLAKVDAVSPDHPVLLRRADLAYFANSKALALARIDRDTPDPRGGRFGRDRATGQLNGMLFGRAAERLVQLVPPPTIERKLIGARAALADLAKSGITSIHDVARIDAVTQTQLFPTFVERSYSDVRIFEELRRRGELTVRVYPMLTLRSWSGLAQVGIAPGSGDEWIRYGALKGFVDGMMMREPFADDPRFTGGFTFRVVDEATMREDIVAADRAGFDAGLHVLGDRAHGLLLDWFEAAVRANPPRDRRLRLIHAWYPSPADVKRAGALRLIADITPQHLIDEVPTLEKQLGPERARFAFPWRALADAGVRLDIVSDWPGGYNEQIPTALSPVENIFMAVTRRGLDGRPAGGFHPEQALTVEEAVRGYTANPAFASREEGLKGTIAVGKLADLVVLSKDILTVPVTEIPSARVLYTILGGRIVYEAPPAPGGKP
jgi:predicted amidohydrolase YtcJ